MKRATHFHSIVAVAAVAFALTAGAQTAKLSHADESFMKDAAQAGMTEIEGGKLALSKAVDPQIKTFAQQLVDDHTKAADELGTLARSKGVKLPEGPSLVQKAKLKMLSSADGVSFDRRFADSIGVSAHQDAVKLFTKAAQGAKDADVKAFASKTLPTLQHHLEMAQGAKSAAAAEVKTTGKPKG